MSRMPNDRRVTQTVPMPRIPVDAELPEYVREALASENPSRFFTMNKQQVADYLETKGVLTNRYKIARAIYDGTLASKREGKRRLVSEYDALVYALSGRERFSSDSQSKASA